VKFRIYLTLSYIDFWQAFNDTAFYRWVSFISPLPKAAGGALAVLPTIVSSTDNSHGQSLWSKPENFTLTRISARAAFMGGFFGVSGKPGQSWAGKGNPAVAV
jgi:hypothetical protein